MKKVTLVLIFVFLACVEAQAAPDRFQKVDFGVDVSASLPAGGDLGDTAKIGLSTSYGIKQWLALGISAGWTCSSTDAGRIGLVPIFGDVIFRAASNDRAIVPYGVVGLGAVIASPQGDRPEDKKLESTTAFAAKLGGGIDWFMSDNVIFNLETGYVFTSSGADVVTQSTGDSLGDKDLNYWYAGVGLKYVYN